MALTFTRASSATYRDVNGLIATAGTDVLRAAHYTAAGVGPLTRIEPAATNLLTYSKSMDNTLPSTTWSGSGVVHTPNFAISPEGTLTASRITGPSAGNNWHAVATVVASTIYTFSWFAKNNGGAGVAYSVHDVTHGADIVASTDYFSLINGVTFTRISVTFTTPAACTSINVYPARDGVGALDLIPWGAQLELGAVATMPIATTTVAATRAADFLSVDFQSTVEAMTFLLDAYEIGRSGIADRRFFTVGNAASGNPTFYAAEKLGVTANTINSKHNNGTASTVSADNADVTFAETNHVEARVVLNTDASHGVAVTLDGGTEGTLRTGAAPAGGLVTPFAATTRLYIGNYAAVVGEAMSIYGMGAAQGVQTLATMRSLIQPLSGVSFGGSVAVTGTAIASINETDVRAGSKTLILTLTGDTWVTTGATFNAQRQAIINGITSAQSELLGWNNEVRAKLAVGTVVQTSPTVVTITLSAQAGYNITAQETITITVPAAALTGGVAIVAAPTFNVAIDAPLGGGPDAPTLTSMYRLCQLTTMT